MPAAVPIAAAAVTAGAGLVTASKNRKAARQEQAQVQANNAQAQQNFDRQMTQTVQERVADAQKAGVSPLAALGVSGTPGPPAFQVARRRGGTYNPMDAIGEIMRGFMQAEDRKASARVREGKAAETQAYTNYLNSERQQRVLRDKAQAETNALKMQTELQRQRLLERQLQLAASDVEARANAQGKPVPLWEMGYDNRSELGPPGS